MKCHSVVSVPIQYSVHPPDQLIGIWYLRTGNLVQGVHLLSTHRQYLVNSYNTHYLSHVAKI